MDRLFCAVLTVAASHWLIRCSPTARLLHQPKTGPSFCHPNSPTCLILSNNAVIRRDKFRTHFQYLMASVKSTRYDYFAITAGSMRLAERFESEARIKGYSALQILRLKRN